MITYIPLDIPPEIITTGVPILLGFSLIVGIITYYLWKNESG
jgi:hypothetical protein